MKSNFPTAITSKPKCANSNCVLTIYATLARALQPLRRQKIWAIGARKESRIDGPAPVPVRSTIPDPLLAPELDGGAEWDQSTMLVLALGFCVNQQIKSTQTNF